MPGLPTYVDPAVGTTGNNALDTQLVIRSQGTTAQNMTPAALAASGGSVANGVVDARLPGNPKPGDARAGYLGAGMPEGNPSNDVAQAYGGANLLTVGRPAGTAGGGGIYPQGFQAPATGPVPNPMIRSGFAAQGVEPFIEFAYQAASLVHTVGGTVSPVTLALSNGGAGTFTVTVKEVNGVLTSALPTGFTSVAAATGVFTIGTTGAAGVYTFGLVVTDTGGRTAEASVVITLT